MSVRFAIGIDLGTTNCVLAWMPLEEQTAQPQLLPIPQLVDRGTVEARESLPSFTYLATDTEAQSGACDLPWCPGADYAVGELARRQSADNPDRTVGAAKSWLCHGGVDRNSRILPWQAPEGNPRISPVDASQRYLEHLVEVWDAEHPDDPIEDQHVVLTVPASFDPAARELTRAAACKAGLPESLVLLEEPQAAVYAWLQQMGEEWRNVLSAGETLLVCDVGGGTTDLTLVEVSDEDGNLVLQRRAVGDHLLVGGDNMDAALAYHAASLFEAKNVQLDPWQSVSLWHSCRAAKEALLAERGPKSQTVSVLGRGSKLIGGTVSVKLERDQAAELLIQGFLPDAAVSDQPERNVQVGFQEMGLPWEQDTGITRHIADFLTKHGDEDAVRPTWVLFNGGVFQSERLRSRLLEVMQGWFNEDSVALLDGTHDLDNAVALGAAFYGWTRPNGGIRIRGGSPRSWYVGIETTGLAIPGAPRPLRGLCVVPQGMEEGTECEVPSADIGLIVGQPARFRFFGSTVRPDDKPGALLPSCSSDELVETNSLETKLKSEADGAAGFSSVPVRFCSRVTELGVLELWCVSTTDDRRWKLEFDVRESQ